MEDNKLHLVAFDVPYPPDYGGAIDVFYKIKYLKELGFEINLHCFSYGRKPQKSLEEICNKVYYYKRNYSPIILFKSLPLAVSSRINKNLKANLEKDNFPIIFDGIQSSYYMPYFQNKKRKTLLRLHNIDSQYYSTLYKTEKFGLKKIFFFLEKYRLKKYEIELLPNVKIAAISKFDQEYFLSKNYTSDLVDPFHEYNAYLPQNQTKNYILYHGNLSIVENQESIKMLLEKVFSKLDYPIIIAGKNPTTWIKKAIEKFSHIQLIENPDHACMQSLIAEAKINLCYSLYSNGIKLKLIQSMFSAGHIIVDAQSVKRNSLEKAALEVANCESEIAEICQKLVKEDFSQKLEKERKLFLENHFVNKKSAEKLIRLLLIE